MTPFAFADDDDDRGNGKSKNRDDDKKSWMFQLPFGALGTTTNALSAQIKSLQETLDKLKKDRRALEDDYASTTKAAREAFKIEIKGTEEMMKDAKKDLKFVRSLSRGMSGDDVRDLQELLAQDPTIFDAAFATGFFGVKTEQALRKFQRKHGISAIGVFGPKSQAKILALFVGRPLPPGIIKRLGLETSSTTPGQGFVTVCHKPAGANPHTLVIAVPALGAHLGHGDAVGVCFGSGSTTTPDTTKPVLSNINSSVGTSSATLTWNTNENSNSDVLYGLTSGYGSSTTNSLMVTSHSLMVVGLTPSTLYHFLVKSADAAGNVATSSDMTFTTNALPVVDAAAPVLSAIATSTTATAATVSWTTSEPATSRLYFATTTPVNTATATHTQDLSLVTNHSMPLSSLTASSTYYFLILSADAAGNNATSSQMWFKTL